LVLPVGGIREKVLAARRYGIHTVVLPHANEVDLTELTADVRADMKFFPVRTLEEALAVSIPDVQESTAASTPPPPELADTTGAAAQPRT
jgi:ATP-dependent Lon protease